MHRKCHLLRHQGQTKFPEKISYSKSNKSSWGNKGQRCNDDLGRSGDFDRGSRFFVSFTQGLVFLFFLIEKTTRLGRFGAFSNVLMTGKRLSLYLGVLQR
jgi:hypothetical protein